MSEHHPYSRMNRGQFEQRCRGFARWYPCGNDRLVAVVHGVHKLVVDSMDFSLTPHLVMDGFWESWISLWCYRNTALDSHVINMGANCGYFTMLFAHAGAAKVVAVEPQRKLADGIRISAMLNGYAGQVSVAECVASDTTAHVWLNQHRFLAGSAFVGDSSGDDFNAISVPSRVTSELMPTATHAFIDAEGHEPQVIRGLAPLMAKRQLEWIALEWTPGSYENASEFFDELFAYGNISVINPDGASTPVTKQHLLSVRSFEMVVVRRRV